jgi:hypothetical protein
MTASADTSTSLSAQTRRIASIVPTFETENGWPYMASMKLEIEHGNGTVRSIPFAAAVADDSGIDLRGLLVEAALEESQTDDSSVQTQLDRITKGLEEEVLEHSLLKEFGVTSLLSDDLSGTKAESTFLFPSNFLEIGRSPATSLVGSKRSSFHGP